MRLLWSFFIFVERKDMISKQSAVYIPFIFIVYDGLHSQLVCVKKEWMLWRIKSIRRKAR